ncbi:protein ABSCISIC ACID-INSENSITIVE 5-like [Lotus japonicus]|uniref:protein ABSCISIC ACID-INSENSITIVE 5-like n=1 Tax=Lotus japonicus TaxID=34305 RepID=UPI0025856312|nr:protein ABSCISIC ACID-INSENSITIVE 5-like [Lotus japonicus]XP_057427297.1 protein ABSCISIC ACID-INSENSITIVE 5-like [Lotus japonicus]
MVCHLENLRQDKVKEKMVVTGSEMNSQGGDGVSNQQEANKNHSSFSSLGRQSSSIYSLTLDEFQHTLCEPGRNFGSMNMDEFINSIWSAEENQATNNNNPNQNNNNINNNNNLSLSETSTEKLGFIRKQPSLPRHGSLTIPAPLCRKTVDEVWSEIHKGQQSQQQNNNNNNGQNTESVPRQPTFGEMTLEDFLVKAGVVREQGANSNAMPLQVPSSQHQLLQQQFGMYPNVGPSFRPTMAIGAGGWGGNAIAVAVAPPYPVVAHSGSGGAIVESKRDGGYSVPGVGYGGQVMNGGGGGYGGNMGIGAPVSPVSPDGMGGGENSGGQFGMEMGVLRGRKRGLDGPVEKVVERRQRRMIKNRESAARSRARKQAYTIELEAELNQLKEENAQLKLALAELERRRKQQYLEETNGMVQTNAQKTKKKLSSLRRTLSCPF